MAKRTDTYNFFYVMLLNVYTADIIMYVVD